MARVIAFSRPGFTPEPPVDRNMQIAVAQRIYLAVEDALAGKWSDSNLISQLAAATPIERGLIIAELERRTWADRT